jgi:tetratricopeptide (TPR) repeat protein
MASAPHASITTILFTDLVNSTEIIQQLGDERAQQAFAAHHARLHELVSSHGGRELQWLGDGLMAAFPSSGDAVCCVSRVRLFLRRRLGRLSIPLLVALCCTGCVSRGASLDPEVRWRQAERRWGAFVEAREDVRRLRNDYDAVILLDRSGELRGRAYLRLAELDLAQQEYESAGANLERALRAGLESADRVAALLLLGDVLERRLDRPDDAEAVYRQILHEHPGSAEAELAQLRLEHLDR